MIHRYPVYFLLSVLLGVSTVLPTRATHIYGGEIRATAVSCQSYTYNITVVLYTDTDSDVEFKTGLLDLGFGDLVEVETATDLTVSGSASEFLQVRTLEIERTFPGPGTYTLNFRDFNRNANIINIPNAVQTPFYAETELVIDPLLCNSPPVLSEVPNPFASAGSRYELLLGATDPDGDSLSVELVAPHDEANREIRGYQLPINYDLGLLDNPVASDGISLPTLIVSPQSLVWDAPNLGGEFVVAVRVNEWRKVDGEWVPLGYVTRDIVIQVANAGQQTTIPELLVTGVEEAFNEPSVFLYPNPTTGPLSLEVRDDTWQGGIATMYNIIGESLNQRTIALGSNSYDVTSFTSGFYFLNLRKGELQKTLRFVKR